MTSIRTSPDGAPPERAKPFGFRPLNIALLAAGVAAISVGYVLLSRGSTTAAPLLLMLGYAGLVPAGLLMGLGAAEDGTVSEGE